MRSRRNALGQNFLHHKPTIQKIVDLCRDDVSKHKPKSIIEVGPGKLAITEPLLTLASNEKLPMELVERDPRLREDIEASIAGKQATLTLMDAASDEFSELIRTTAKNLGGPVQFISNLPYSAASQIIAQLCYASNNLTTAIVMVQKEMAERMAAPAKSSERGAFSLLVQSYFKVEICFDVGPGAFNPPPKVKSTVLRLTPLTPSLVHDLSDPLKFESFCKRLFSGRRKMVRNLIPQSQHGVFQNLGISGTERPEALELKSVLGLYKAIGEVL